MKENDKIRLQHIQESIQEIESFTVGITSEEFCKNRLIRNAAIRSLEIIGEAVAALSEDIRDNKSDFPWQDWKDFRNILIHQYFGVDYIMVYNAIQNDLPLLKKEVSQLLKGTSSPPFF
jgi:uncharacterized protein with HEPN domain